MQRGKLRVHDPFELIRWLALSQTDPRKALAELVQNSLDAGASAIRVTRVRTKKIPCLRVWDDGEGVIPEMDRPEALEYLATHIGHSRKRKLTPRERLDLMTQGQYGIGLLGFWCLGETLEVRTSIPGQRAHRLILHRDRPDYTIEPLRGRLPFAERWTEVLVVGVNPEALRALACRRAAAVEVSDDLPGARSDEGIQEPELLDEPAAPWRSRFQGERWQVNSGHPEYRSIADRPALKLRYLVLLFAKEVVLRSSQDPRLEGALEQMVEVAAYADRNLAKKRSARRGRRKPRREG